MGKKTLSSTLGRPTMTLQQYLRQFGLQYADLDAMIISYPEAFDHCYNRLLQLVYSLVIIDKEPESIDDTFFKFCIFVNGKATVFRTDEIDEGVLRALNGVPSDIPDVYYMPEDMIVENPTFSNTYKLTRGVDCEVVYCRQIDRYTGGGATGGLGSLIRITAQLLADNIMSLNIAQKNTRLSVALTADDEATKRSAEEAMRAMYAGEPFKCVMGNLVGTLQGVPVNVTTTNRYIVDLIQAQQYILAHFYEQIGLQTHDQMKKERLITDEVNDNADLAIYNIYSIIESINEGLDRVNAMFGTDMHAYLNPLIAKQLQPAPEPEEPKTSPEGGEEDGQEENNPGGDGSSDAAAAGELPADNPGTEILLDAVGIPEPEAVPDNNAAPEQREDALSDETISEDPRGSDAAAGSDDDGPADQIQGDANADKESSSEEQREDGEPEEDDQQTENDGQVNIEINIDLDAPPEEPEVELQIEGGDPDGPDPEESPGEME